ncbi:MAG: succinate dehydrogenase cytochrome b subunit [Bacteroidales bacterium]|jgi:succinate dehydrogenase / fumarate reductase cytochrome b subunit|nr:succinate dehydrogenase cytochrome b subunit [Bacteroidales bacterium]
MSLVKLASITKKMTIASVGAFLLVFLPMHMGLNLCILREDGGEWYRNVCHFMGTNWIVKIMEVVLMLSVLVHVVVAILLTIENKKARPVGYAVPSKSKTHAGSKWMIYTGVIVLVFLIIHFINFYFVKFGIVVADDSDTYTVEVEDIQKHLNDKVTELQEQMMNGTLSQEQAQEQMMALQLEYMPFLQIAQTGQPSDKISKDGEELINLSKEELKQFVGEDFTEYEPDFYTMCKKLFANPTYSIIYLFALVILGIHLFHAINSIFQTFGLNHRKYNKAIEYLAAGYALIIPLGFAIVPLFVMFCK